MILNGRKKFLWSKKVFIVFDAIFAQLPRDFIISSITVNLTTKKFRITVFQEKVAAFWSKAVEKVQQNRFLSTCVLFESFCCQNVGKRSTKT